MKRLLVLVLIIFACLAALGFYRGWFNLSTDGSEHSADVKIGVNRDKIQGDEDKVKNAVHELGHKQSGKTDQGSDDPERRRDGP